MLIFFLGNWEDCRGSPKPWFVQHKNLQLDATWAYRLRLRALHLAHQVSSFLFTFVSTTSE